MDDRLIDYEAGVGLGGFVWGVKWQALYPGMRLVAPSLDATHWSEALGVCFYEASIETNAHNIQLVSSDLLIRAVQPGSTPFAVPKVGRE